MDKRTAPDTTPGPIQSVSVVTLDAPTVTRGAVNRTALRRLVELHHRGWLTRADLEHEFGATYDRLAAIAAIPYWRLS